MTSLSLSLSLAAARNVSGASGLAFNGAGATTATVDAAYSAGLAAAGGTGPYTYSIAPSSTWSEEQLLALGLYPTANGLEGEPLRQFTFTGIKCRVTDSLSATADSAAFNLTIGPNTVDGIVVGQNASSGVESGYRLVWADDFVTSKIRVRSQRPSGAYERYVRGRTYLNMTGGGFAGNALESLENVDPYWTGYNDLNRGAAIGFDNVTQSASVLQLKARPLDAGEKKFLQGQARRFVTGSISGMSAIAYFPGTVAGGTQFFIKYYVRFSSGVPNGWHPTLWSQSCTPGQSFDSNEVDIEGHTDVGTPSNNGLNLNANRWSSAGAPASAGTGTVNIAGLDNAYHEFMARISTTTIEAYLDNTTQDSFTPTDGGAGNGANSKQKLQSFLVTNHIYTGGYKGINLDEPGWLALSAGADIDIDRIEVYGPPGGTHYRPVSVITPQNYDYNSGGGTNTYVIPSQATLWGGAVGTEYVQVVQHEDYEHGVLTHSTIGWNQFPTGVSYDAGTRTLTFPTTSPGRFNVMIHAHNGAGSSCEPVTFPINIGPKVNIEDITSAVGQVLDFDIYGVGDCGALTTDEDGNCAKTYAVSGLPSGLSYNASTFHISGTIGGGATTGTYTVACTNSMGQTTSVDKTWTIGTVSSYLQIGNADMVAHYRADYVDVDGSNNVTLIKNKACFGSHSNLVTSLWGKFEASPSVLGSGTIIKTAALAPNGLDGIQIVRDPGEPPRAMADVGAPISTMFQGSNKPFSTAIAFRARDTEVGPLFSVGATLPGNSSEFMVLNRNNGDGASQSNIFIGSSSNYGLIRHTRYFVILVVYDGTNVNLWYRDGTAGTTTQGLTNVAKSYTLSEAALFVLWASHSSNASIPAYAGSSLSLDWFEQIVWDRALTGTTGTGEIGTVLSTTAGTGMPGEWGIT